MLEKLRQEINEILKIDIDKFFEDLEIEDIDNCEIICLSLLGYSRQDITVKKFLKQYEQNNIMAEFSLEEQKSIKKSFKDLSTLKEDKKSRLLKLNNDLEIFIESINSNKIIESTPNITSEDITRQIKRIYQNVGDRLKNIYQTIANKKEIEKDEIFVKLVMNYGE